MKKPPPHQFLGKTNEEIQESYKAWDDYYAWRDKRGDRITYLVALVMVAYLVYSVYANR